MATSSPPSSLLANAAVVFGTIPSIIGIRGLLAPTELITSAGFPRAAPESLRLVEGVTRLYAARNVVISSICFAVWYRGDRKLLGATMLLVGLSPIADAFVSWQVVGGGLWNHLPAVPICWGLGLALLR
ncbi:hypothetical protein LQW54_007295 [Pestalotiopsis sp. IQ-011]